MTALTELERELLDFEGKTWRYQSMKEQAARDQFDMTAVRYQQVINALIRRPEALAYAPMLVRRRQRLRARNRAKTMTT